jgi:hypothetical protein
LKRPCHRRMAFVAASGTGFTRQPEIHPGLVNSALLGKTPALSILCLQCQRVFDEFRDFIQHRRDFRMFALASITLPMKVSAKPKITVAIFVSSYAMLIRATTERASKLGRAPKSATLNTITRRILHSLLGDLIVRIFCSKSS